MHILIVGRGYAGCLLSYFLASEGARVTVADKNEPDTSTKVSAGIMLPVTGRRLAKTYMADTVIPFAFSTYKKAEQISGIDFFYEKNVLQLFNSTGNKNHWFARSSDDDVIGYTGPIIETEQIPEHVNSKFGGIILKKSGFVDPFKLLAAFKEIHKDNITFVNDSMRYQDLKIETSEILWNSETYDLVIFCEGHEAVQNPWFDHVPFKPAKGEIIDFNAPSLTEEFIINGNIFILPMGNGQFRAGSTYEWNDLSTNPTDQGKAVLSESLRNLISCDYTITNHKAGIRPSVKDRRPVLGFHHEYNRIGIFNGLGTKGVMLAPYFASLMSNYIIKKENPSLEFDVSRFNGLLSKL